MRIFIIESFDENTSNGTAQDIKTKEHFRFERDDLDNLDGLAFPGEYVTADVVDGGITNLSAVE